MIHFLLNQTVIVEENINPNLSVLNYLRNHRRRSGSKEGCASGECGACTVVLGQNVNGQIVYETANSCIMPISALHGKQLITIEDLKQSGFLHPVQRAIVDNHAAQCGFCSPGVVMSLFTLRKNSFHWDLSQTYQALAGNLCRCTGYHAIIAAAQQMYNSPDNDQFSQNQAQTLHQLALLKSEQVEEIRQGECCCFIPKTMEQFVTLYQQYPTAQLLAGGTDLMIKVTQQYQQIPLLIDINHIAELKRCELNEKEIILGATTSIQHCYQLLLDKIPEVSQILSRFASLQIRYQATLAGNIANASPIGDTPPMLLALNADLLLQKGDQLRRLPIAEFFIDYRQTALQSGEFIRAIIIPRVMLSHNFRAWKISKRADDDISSVSAAFSLELDEQNRISNARIAYGGMAATPKRATLCEQQLNGQLFTLQTIERACLSLEQDFQPLSDFRASAAYRLQVAKNLLRRYYSQLTTGSYLTEVEEYVGQ